jgi:hypothetical protein
MKISVTIELPDDLTQEFIQMIRVFDMKHDPNHEGRVKVAWFGESNEMPFEKLQAIMESVDPPFAFRKAFKKDEPV